MKTISQIIAGAQALLSISFNLAGCFEEYLPDEYKTFLQMLRVIEEQTPTFIRPYAETGRISCQYTPFIRGFLAKGYFGIEKTGRLIQRLKGEPNLRLLCGFTNGLVRRAFHGRLRICQSRAYLSKPLTGWRAWRIKTWRYIM
jgi:hypothetical protein